MLLKNFSYFERSGLAKHGWTQHAACFFHQLIIDRCPVYLYNRISFRTNVHTLNIRCRGLLTPLLYRTVMFKRSFSSPAYIVVLHEFKLPSLFRFKISIEKKKTFGAKSSNFVAIHTGFVVVGRMACGEYFWFPLLYCINTTRCYICSVLVNGVNCTSLSISFIKLLSLQA